ncbi:phosphatase PAP2 family protein [Persicobacter psychrovividus]|uniref:Phosphatase PAP2 family protein n=1 Tax=Persicobacter psychrovividus TaxID=387638 RepID=A0ABM7VGG1_9BACT|nr:phosphatase PAP2 family protein [Persicobacter psychrovividus]
MLQQIFQLDQGWFLALNQWHWDFLDPIMYAITYKFTWIPFYAVLLYFLVKQYKKEVWVWILAIVVCIVCADQLASGLIKPLFMRPRPSHEPLLEGLVHVVGTRGGKFGFVSSHASNTFGLSLLLYKIMKPRYPWIKWLFFWAVVVAYSRIYVGVHYPLDVIGGALVGLFSGWVAVNFGNLLTHLFLKKDEEKNG